MHNSTCKRETSFTVLVTNYVTFSTYSTLKYVLLIMLNTFHNSICKSGVRNEKYGTKKYGTKKCLQYFKVRSLKRE